ncbi:nucleoid-associated protein Lsr2 [Arthrobacter sp. RIT-PI-e]|uniref:histone-like nucleoid-structuring protein Lsr2 n=1 Tax=Arthrobacter sp. RIT-PI-e TaxID=1681197 RepID=UPI0006769DFD|nr:Lsr2 family protein [Arthrobacter sp. RIT-PI-e]KNC19034.1 nucleoid-associated protein Lsr2 [Arthrobacter sp. RIT-PI-e]
MAQKVHVHLIDDLTGGDADETVRFGLDGTNYEIDLTTDNANQLRSTLSEYVDKARKANSGGRKSQGGQKNTSTGSGRSKEETQAIRQWAQDNGYNPSTRGRITQSIIDAYNQAH